MAHACNSSTWGKEAGGWGVKGCPWIQIKFEANLDYVKPVLKKKKLIFMLQGQHEDCKKTAHVVGEKKNSKLHNMIRD